IDLSVGAVMAFSGVTAALGMSEHHVGIGLAVIVACITGLLLGTGTGLLSAYGKIPTFIVTLGMMGIVHGSAGVLSHSQNVGGQVAGFDVFGFGEFLGSATNDGIPYAAIMMVVAAVGVHIALSKTKWG